MRFAGLMSTATVNYSLARLATETTTSHGTAGHVGRVYVLNSAAAAAALDDLGTQTSIIAREGQRSRIVEGTTRPPTRLQRLTLRRRAHACGAVERVDLSLNNGWAQLDHELDSDRVVVRTWSPRDGSELDQTLWWHGHPVLARQLGRSA